MKNLLYTLALVVGITTATQAQMGYNTAIGLRAGETSGLTFKKSLGSNAFEGILGVWNHGFTVTGLYEWYQPTGLKSLNWYYGLGGHLAANTWSHHWYDSRRDKYFNDGRFGLGVDGILGIEFKIPNAPIALSLDLKPFIEFGSYGYIYTSIDPGLGIKVAF